MVFVIQSMHSHNHIEHVVAVQYCIRSFVIVHQLTGPEGGLDIECYSSGRGTADGSCKGL